MSEAWEIGPGLFAYKVDDGADHWVIATDAADAKALVLVTHYPDGMPEEWDEVEATMLSQASLEKATFDGDDGVVTMLVEMRRVVERRYVACSEY